GEHNAVLVDKRLYFHGGWSLEEKGMAPNQLFYLDVSKSFTTFDISLMPWTDLSSISGVTRKTGATACVDETTIYFIGGSHYGGLVSKFDTISLQWSEPTTSGSIPVEEIRWTQCVILGHKIYIYGGYTVLLDTSKLFWSTFTSSLIYSGTQDYSATLLNDSIIYIGGASNTLGAQHNRILLFYGTGDITINSLDTLTFIWTIPVILNSGGPLRYLVEHTATLIEAYILIAFGFYLNDKGALDSSTSDIFLLDVSHKDNYKWVTTYDPINSIQPIPASPTSPSNINIGAVIAGTIVGGII
ncbi:16218_t:CDS:2, partial [Gigaspora margarita]